MQSSNLRCSQAIADVEVLRSDLTNTSGVPRLASLWRNAVRHLGKFLHLLAYNPDVFQGNIRYQQSLSYVISNLIKTCFRIRCNDDFIGVHLSKAPFQIIEHVPE